MLFTRRDPAATRRRLVLVRHAEAEVGAGRQDRDRDLTEAGSGDAVALGRWLSMAVRSPATVVVSPALRTRRTWEIASAALPRVQPPALDPSVYEAGPEALLRAVQELPPGAQDAILVGHAPGIPLLSMLLGGAEVEQALGGGFAPGCAVLLEHDKAWSELWYEDARLVAVRPEPVRERSRR